MAIVLEAWLFQRVARHHEEADFMVQLLTPPRIPFAPALDAELAHGRVLFIGRVIHAHDLADVRGGGVRVRERTLINQSDLPAACAEFEGGGDAKAAATENEESGRLSHIHVQGVVAKFWARG